LALRKKNRNPSGLNLSTSLIFILPFIYLVFSLLVKYYNQDLSIKNFDLLYIGNLINIFFFLAYILLFLFQYLKTPEEFYSRKNFYLILNTLQLVFLFVGVILNKIHFSFPSFYLLGHPSSQVIVGLIFIISQFIQFFLISIVWVVLFKIKSLVYLRSFVNSILIIVVLLIFSFFYAQKLSRIEKLNVSMSNKADIAVVLGAAVWSKNKPSDILKWRLNKVVELYQKGFVKKIQLTGSNAPGEMTEAEVAFNYLKTTDINLNDVLIERNTTSTVEQVSFIKREIMDKQGYKKIIVVSDKYHLKRIKEISRFYNIKTELAGSKINLKFKDLVYYKFREGVALLVFWLFAL